MRKTEEAPGSKQGQRATAPAPRPPTLTSLSGATGPGPHNQLPSGQDACSRAGVCPAVSPCYLLHQLPLGPPPARLHRDDDALRHPGLGTGPCGPRRPLRLGLDAQPPLQLCDEPLLGGGPAQGGGVQPAARGGLPGHGVRVACLPAPPDHGADLRGEGKLSQPHSGSARCSVHTRVPGKGGAEVGGGGAQHTPGTQLLLSADLGQDLQGPGSSSLKWVCIFSAALEVTRRTIYLRAWEWALLKGHKAFSFFLICNKKCGHSFQIF